MARLAANDGYDQFNASNYGGINCRIILDKTTRIDRIGFIWFSHIPDGSMIVVIKSHPAGNQISGATIASVISGNFSEADFRGLILPAGTYSIQFQLGTSTTMGVLYGRNGYGSVSGNLGGTTITFLAGLYSASGSVASTTYAPALLIEGAASVTAPTVPGAFTQPTGTLETGDSKSITWGASTDADGNFSKYVLEASINGGAFAQIGQPTTTSFTYAIPTATSIKFRVKGVDAGGLESAYRESPLFTVTKPMYYWSKYNLKYDCTYKVSDKSAPYLISHGYVEGYAGYQILNCAFSPNGTFAKHQWSSKISVMEPFSPTRMNYYIPQAQQAYWVHEIREIVTVESQGSLIFSDVISVEGSYPTNGKHTDGYWYVRGSRVNQSIAPTGIFTSPPLGTVLKPSEVVAITFGASTAPSISLYEVDYRYEQGAWTALPYNNTLTRSLTITTNIDLKHVELRVRAKNTSNVYSDYVYSSVYEVQHSVAPTLTIDTLTNYSLYKGDTIPINGSVLDPDVGDAVSVKYQIDNNSSRTIATGISTGEAIPFTKSLTFRDGKLFDGATEIFTGMVENATYSLRIWAEDEHGSKSLEHTTTLSVILNYPPTINMISTAYPNLQWEVVDPDPEGFIARTSLFVNGVGLYTQENPPKDISYELTPGKLVFGDNEIIITAVDDFGAEVMRKFKAVMTRVRIPETQLTIRLDSPTTSDVLLTMKRDDVSEDLSITRITGGID